MAEFFEYDPVSGIRTDFDYDETGRLTLYRSSDIEPVLEYNKRLRNNGAADRGIKEDWWLYAKIPPIVQLQLRAKGIDLSNQDHLKRAIQEINTHYPYLKCTEKMHDGKSKLVIGGH